MKSIVNSLKKIRFDKMYIPEFKQIEKLENDFYNLKNDHTQLNEDYDQLQHEKSELEKLTSKERLENVLLQGDIDALKDSDEKALVSISRKLSELSKGGTEKELTAQFQLHRAKIMDHFTMAYIAELNLKPSEVKLVTQVTPDNEIEMFFEKHSAIIS